MVPPPEVLRRGLARLIEARVGREMPEPRMWSLKPGKVRIAQPRTVPGLPEVSEQKSAQGGVDDRS